MVYREHLWAVCLLPFLSRFWEVDSHCQVCMASPYTGWTMLLAYSLHSQLIRCWSYRCHFVSIFFSKHHVPSRSYAWWLQEAFRLFFFFKKCSCSFSFFFQSNQKGGASHVTQAGFELAIWRWPNTTEPTAYVSRVLPSGECTTVPGFMRCLGSNLAFLDARTSLPAEPHSPLVVIPSNFLFFLLIFFF